MGIWGTITGYRLQRTFDHAVVLNTDGTVQEGFSRDPEPPGPLADHQGKEDSGGGVHDWMTDDVPVEWTGVEVG